MTKLDTAAVATILVVIFAVIGGTLVVLSAVLTGMDPALKLTFAQYLERMAYAVGFLAIGRGLAARKTR